MPNPIVLVHGAWHGGWCWDPVAETLRERGHDVVAPDLPLTGLHEDAAALRGVLDEHGGSAVLMGHSYGGMVINEAAVGRRDVGHLAFLCAFCPDGGETLNDLYSQGERVRLSDGFTRHPDHTVTIDPAVAPEAFYADCAPEQIDRALARLRPIATRCMTTAAAGAAWREMPATYIVCGDDRAIHVDLQRQMGQRAGRLVHWDVSHSPFLSRPALVIDLLEELAAPR